ncbi:thiamine pyrophosphate-binding protein [Candidatus Margulisiibacteriota bacterium]
MKLSDFVVDFLAKEGIKHVFGVTGGAVVHLFDSVDRNPEMMPVFNHHEQASALASESYAKITNSFGATFVTTGPGCTNAITGVAAAWLDSIPCIYISGQARLEHTTRDKPIRQLGSQQMDIIPLVEPITNYAAMVDDPTKIKYYLQKAVYLAKTGRPGPVWLDIPLNFQWADVNVDDLLSFDPSELKMTQISDNELSKAVKKCVEMIASSERPLIHAGYGIRLAHANKEFEALIRILGVPFISSWTASDFFPTSDALYAGRIGIAGQRGGNFAVQNCDLLLSIGSHLSITQTGTNFKAFARGAKKIVVDIDRAELGNPTVKVDVSINSDTKRFLQELIKQLKAFKGVQVKGWIDKCLKYKKYNMMPEEWKKQKDNVNPYVFVDFLSDKLNSDDVVVVDGGGTVVYTSFQAFKVKKGQRIILSSGVCAMGTGVPESIGACFANNKKRTICFCGDGSMQFNIQELQTIVHHNLPIKIFIFNNGGYLAIRHTQKGFLEGRYVGSDAKGGLSLPDFKKVTEAYGIKFARVNNHEELSQKIDAVLNSPEPMVCEIMCSKDQEVIPRLNFKKNTDGTNSPMPLEDMYPFLDRKEFKENMSIEPLPESK